MTIITNFLLKDFILDQQSTYWESLLFSYHPVIASQTFLATRVLIAAI
jgi:hypothetical protein